MKSKNSRYIDAGGIMRRLPHRFPFLMIDRVLEWNAEQAVAVKNVSINEPFFVGHFPEEPIFPGMLLGEAMAQTAAFIGAPADQELDAAGGIGAKAFLTSINLKIDRPVVPGDQIMLKAKLIKRLGQLMKITVQANVDGEKVASAEITVATVND